MRKVLSLLLTLALVGGALASVASAAGKKPRKAGKTTRTETADYTTSGSSANPAGSANVCLEAGCLSFVPLKGEKYVSFSATDTTGMPAPFLVSLDGGEAQIAYCGSTDVPVWLNDAETVSVAMASSTIPDCAGTSTTGTLTATFSNLP